VLQTTLWGIKILLRKPPTNLDALLEPFSHILPSGLLALEFRSHSNFEQRIEALPSALESLIFYGTSEFDFPLDEVLPPTLKALRFGDDFPVVVK
jgi:hypothetical protein